MLIIGNKGEVNVTNNIYENKLTEKLLIQLIELMTENKIEITSISKYSDHPNQLPVISNQRMNQYLKELYNEVGIDEPITIVKYQANERIEKVKKKYELIGSHSARRTFIILSL